MAKTKAEVAKMVRAQKIKQFSKLTLEQRKIKNGEIMRSARRNTAVGKIELSVLKKLILPEQKANKARTELKKTVPTTKKKVSRAELDKARVALQKKPVPKGSHRMPDGSIMKDSAMKKKPDPNSTGQKNLQELLKLGDLSSKISGAVNDKALHDAMVGMRLSQILDVLTIYEGSVGQEWNREGRRDPAMWVRFLQKQNVPLEMVKLAKLPLRSLVAGLKKSLDARGRQLKEGAVDFKDRNDVLETIGEEFEKHSGSVSVSKFFNFPGDKPKKWRASKEQQASIKTAWSKYWEENFPGQIVGSGDYRNITTKIIHKYFKKEDTTNNEAFNKIWQDVGFHGLKF
mgnify:CR=1 FL=1